MARGCGAEKRGRQLVAGTPPGEDHWAWPELTLAEHP